MHYSHLRAQIENITFESNEEFKKFIMAAIAEAKTLDRSVIHSVAGMFDIVAYPTGYFQVIPFMSFKIYKFSKDDPNQIEEIR